MTRIHFTKFALLLYPVETDMTSFGFQLSTSIELGYSVHGLIQTELNTKPKEGIPNYPTGVCTFEINQRRNIVSTISPLFLSPKSPVTLFSTLKTHHKDVWGGGLLFF